MACLSPPGWPSSSSVAVAQQLGSSSWDIIGPSPTAGEVASITHAATIREVDHLAYQGGQAGGAAGWGATSPALGGSVQAGCRIIEDREEGAHPGQSCLECSSTHVEGQASGCAREFLRGAIIWRAAAGGRILHKSRVDSRRPPPLPAASDVVSVIKPFNFPPAAVAQSVAPPRWPSAATPSSSDRTRAARSAAAVEIAKIFEAGLPARLLSIVVTGIAEISDA